MTALFILLGIAALYALALLTAPEGYEDETGFHFGRASGVHVFSADRRCTCGRDKAIDELITLLDAVNPGQQPQPTDELTVAQIRQRLYGQATACPKEPSHARA